MKKLLLVILALALMTCPALACTADRTGDWMQVKNCEEYISLREAPSTSAEAIDRIPLNGIVVYLRSHDERFDRVLYNGQTGYVLREYVKNLFAVCESCLPQNLNDQELYNLQIFLTNFTEQGMLSPAGIASAEAMEDKELVDFAIEHIWYNRRNTLEWGEYPGGSNVRLSVKSIPEVCLKYFGRIPEDLDGTFHKVQNGYYYWQETGGHVPCGFAVVTGASSMGGGRYRVDFKVLGMGTEWDAEVYSLNEERLREKMPLYFTGDAPCGSAVISVNGGSLMDRSTWTLERLAMDWQYIL